MDNYEKDLKNLPEGMHINEYCFSVDYIKLIFIRIRQD